MASDNDKTIVPAEGGREERASRLGTKWQDMWLCRKSDALCRLTDVFCQRFQQQMDDDTLQQMTRTANTYRQSLEGAGNEVPTEQRLTLLRTARECNRALRDAYQTFLANNELTFWKRQDPRFEQTHAFTRQRNTADEYLPYAQQWDGEEFANTAVTLGHQADSLMSHYVKRLADLYDREQKAREQMQDQRPVAGSIDEMIAMLQQENISLRQQLAQAQAAYDDLKQRALKAYHDQQAQIEALQKQKDA